MGRRWLLFVAVLTMALSFAIPAAAYAEECVYGAMPLGVVAPEPPYGYEFGIPYTLSLSSSGELPTGVFLSLGGGSLAIADAIYAGGVSFCMRVGDWYYVETGMVYSSRVHAAFESLLSGQPSYDDWIATGKPETTRLVTLPVIEGFGAGSGVHPVMVVGFVDFFLEDADRYGLVGRFIERTPDEPEPPVPPKTVVDIYPASPDGLEGWYVTTPMITFATDQPAITYYRWDGTAHDDWLMAAGPILVPEGARTLFYFSVNAEGQEESVQEATVQVDTSDPVTDSDVVDVYQNEACITLSAWDSVSGVSATYYSIDGGPLLVYADGVWIGEPGTYELSFFSVDVAGNTEGAQTIQVFVNGPPEIQILTDPVVVDEGETAFAQFGVSDPNGDEITVFVSAGQVFDNGDGTWSWHFDSIDGPRDSQQVSIGAFDGRGGEDWAEFDLVVSNVAPTVGPIQGPTAPLQVNTELSLSAQFTDPGINDTHSVVWNWGDGAITGGMIEAGQGSGLAIGTHTYSEAGVYAVTATVTDRDGDSGVSVFEYVVIYDPAAGFVTGGGWIQSPAGAYMLDPEASGKATFGFVSRYQRGAHIPSGNTNFRFNAGNLVFESTSYEWLVISGSRARYKGAGKINGVGGYGFMLTATDGQVTGGGGEDMFRLKVWDQLSGETVYDNQPGSADDADATMALGGGNIVIHSGGKGK